MKLIGEDGSLALEETKQLTEVWEGFTYFRDGDVLVAKRITPCFENGKGAFCEHLHSGVGFGTTELHVLRAVASILPRFLFYITRTEEFRNLGAASMYGAAGQQRVPDAFIKDFSVAYPPLPEQGAIVRFLDHEVPLVDALITKKQRLITLLQEKRSTLIGATVTHGLDPDAPMRDSDIPWMGQVPAHWQVEQAKHCLRKVEQGWSPLCESRPASQDEWGVLKVGCVNGTMFNPTENKALPAEQVPILEYEIKSGDVLMSRANTRQLLGSASLVGIVRSRLLLCDKLYRLVVNANVIDPAYLVHALGCSVN